MKLQTNRKKLGQALVVLLASGSFLGLSSLPAMAEGETTVTVEVSVTDSTYVCEDPVTDPYWSPDPGVSYNDPTATGQVDLQFDSQLDFYFGLGFNQGYDVCTGDFLDPTGDVEAVFLDLASPLSLNYLTCLDVCDAAALFANSSSIIDGSLSVDPLTAVSGQTYYTDLKVTWTLDQVIE